MTQAVVGHALELNANDSEISAVGVAGADLCAHGLGEPFLRGYR
jgi:hypothetical protein